MIKKPLHYIRVILAAVMLCSVFFVYADDSQNLEPSNEQKEIILEKAEDDNKTIGELKENIKELHEEKEDINTRLQELKDSSDLWAFFKDTLSDDEIEEVATIIQQYKIINTKINRELLETAEDFQSTETIKIELLEQRKNVYKDLVPYIKIEKLEAYKEYIAGDAIYLVEKKEVDEDIARKEEVIEQKVEKIEEKIEENKKALQERLEVSVSIKVENYLTWLSLNEKFIWLSYEWKITVMDLLIQKIDSKITELKNKSEVSTTTTQQNIDILESVVLKKIQEFKNNLEK